MFCVLQVQAKPALLSLELLFSELRLLCFCKVLDWKEGRKAASFSPWRQVFPLFKKHGDVGMSPPPFLGDFNCLMRLDEVRK
jgi:hypothetical protein